MGYQFYKDERLDASAEQVAEILQGTDTDLRGNLLLMAGAKLQAKGQHFTGKLISSAGIEYGIKPGPDERTA